MVDPVVRGIDPLFTVIGAYLLFGVAVLLAGIFGLATYNFRFLETNRETLGTALTLTIATGLFVALYTIYGAYGIRATADLVIFSS